MRKFVLFLVVFTIIFSSGCVKFVSYSRDKALADGIKERFSVVNMAQSQKRALTPAEHRALHWSAFASIKRLVGEKNINNYLNPPDKETTVEETKKEASDVK